MLERETDGIEKNIEVEKEQMKETQESKLSKKYKYVLEKIETKQEIHQ